MMAVQQVLRGNGVFTNKLYQLLSKNEGNVFFSPIGVHVVLSMLYQGAQDPTKAVLADALNIPDAETAASGYKSIIAVLNSIEDVALLMAFKIYLRRNDDQFEERLKDKFRKNLMENFYSDLQLVDFDDKDGAVKEINGWVEETTHQKIKTVIDEDDIDEETAMFLINAIYFKGDWSDKFREAATSTRKFYVNDKETIDVMMMQDRRKCEYIYDENLNAQIVEIPFRGGKIKMAIILPMERNGIEDLEAKLSSTDLVEVTRKMYLAEVDISLPKFKMETTMELKPILAEMGLLNIFDEDNANFRDIMELAENENLCVDKIFQKAFIEVNESGAEAAAVTVVRMKKVAKCAIEYEEVIFEVDHPAIFMLVAYHDGAANILFYGRLSRPRF